MKWTLVLACFAILMNGGAATAAELPGLPATVVKINPPVSTATYPTLDYGSPGTSSDDKSGTTTWRIIKDTGNCCENYLTITRQGRLLDFGGSYLNFSDDRGLSWSSVRPVEPLISGEGAVVMAPDGDVVGVQWDPYRVIICSPLNTKQAQANGSIRKCRCTSRFMIASGSPFCRDPSQSMVKLYPILRF